MASNVPPGGKSDTSRKPPVIKNPLLSSQVTGLTLDDFAPVAVLLPAAPLPPIVKEPTESTVPTKPAIFSSQQTVTGTIPELPQDTDSFSEIDLTATNEPQTFSQPPTIDYNPLQDLEDTDARAGAGQFGDNGEPSATSYLQQTSALTAQFAAQLPNVASTVFSTFSRVIKGNSPAPPSSLSASSYANDPSVYGSQPEYQSTPNPYELPAAAASLVPLINSSACDPPSYHPPSVVAPDDYQHSGPQSSAELLASPPPPPPTFYNPEQVSSATTALPPPTAPGLSNTYRLGGSKKKTYAHIPGLSTTTHTAGPSIPTALQTPTVPSVTLPPVPPPLAVSTDIRGSFFSESVNLTEANHPAEEPPQSKPSLFSYLPNSILEKLPKPSFGSEKKEEPLTFPGGISSGSVVGVFGDASAAPVRIPAALTPAASVAPPLLNSATQGTASAFFTPPPVVEFTPTPVVPPAQAGSFFSTPAPEVGIEASQDSIVPQTATLAQTAPPPPVFFSPAQIPTVRNAQVGPAASKTNPYSSTRLTGGAGRYKNPLAPIVPPAAGSVFLPNQPPPLAAGQSGKVPSVEPVPVVPTFTPPNIFTPQSVPSAQLPVAPVSTVTSTTPVPVVSEEQPAFGWVSNLQENSVQPAPAPASTYQGIHSVNQQTQQQSDPAYQEIASNQQSENYGSTVTPDLKPPYPVSIFNPYASEHEQQADGTFNDQQSIAPIATSSYKPENLPLTPTTAPIPAFPPFPAPLAPAESVQKQLDTFDIGTSAIEPAGTITSTSDSAQIFSTPFLGTAPPQPVANATKPIVDSRSKSSENVLSPPPRPNSNLSEPAAIFPGSVPPADIFLPEFSGPGSNVLRGKHNQEEGNLSSIPAQDTNGNNLSNFFATNTAVPNSGSSGKLFEDPRSNANLIFPAQAQHQQTKPTVFPTAEPTPAINPVDFFNSNTIVSEETVVGDNSVTTGQTISSVPLFNFFGRSADPPVVAPVAVIAPVEKAPVPQVLLESTDGNQQKTVKQAKSATDQAASASSVSNVSSFSNLNDRFEEEGEQEATRIENASNEPIFSSDNLFDFKSSAYQDGGLYSRDTGRTYDTYDGNSSMAAMATTSVGAQDATTTNTGTSIAESSTTNIAYRPTYNHWFYRREVEGKSVWSPFTMADSMALEDGLTILLARGETEAENDSNPPVIVHTDGGRYDVSIKERSRTPVYWKGPANEVRRCSWFYKTVDSRFVPYEEEVADLLEREYKEAATSGEWHRRVTIPNGETVVFHGPSVIVHFLQTQNPDTWGGGSSPVPATTNRPRVVKRGIDEFNIDDDEPEKIDHLLFMVHGIGEACDLRFRRVEEVVDEFRSISAQLVQSHYRSSFDRGDVGRVEILPISWHDDLHSEESGVDEKLKSITLPSIPKLRHFTNDTLLDVLFYTSPMFCQSIIDAVGKSLNRLYALFCQRNPSFNGRVSLAGHSLGSLILFDLLCHQKRAEQKQPSEPENSENPDDDSVSPLASHHAVVKHRPLVRKCSQQINYEVGPAGTGQPYIAYPQLMFQPKMFFALGSPIGMFVTIRGIDALGLDFKLPTCDGFFNIFHPYDPVAYRIEALVNPELSTLAPVLIPHHKGRKRMHLELKETVLRVGNDLRQRVTDVFRNTLDTVYALTAMGSRPDSKAIEKEVDKVLQDQLKFETTGSTSNLSGMSDVDSGETTLPLGKLNQSRRVDYVLQEAPFEFINEYLFALTSHVCYWDSEDTMLFLMKEIYSSLGVQTDHQVPQQTMTIERPLAATSPVVAPSNCSLNSNYNLFPHDLQSAREGPDNRL
ncbi:mucin-2 isoform X1 [Anopheles funestus]|uniref:mucin-2 isoform X1 n=1 Tax=Anopheles funestus TaxID=62324 RepID=UPI0020C5DCD8|nr:mucin-2 isoform X1 [Anopheles funestus]